MAMDCGKWGGGGGGSHTLDIWTGEQNVRGNNRPQTRGIAIFFER